MHIFLLHITMGNVLSCTSTSTSTRKLGEGSLSVSAGKKIDVFPLTMTSGDGVAVPFPVSGDSGGYEKTVIVSSIKLKNGRRYIPSTDPPERTHSPPWKFWRKLSSRRSDKKSKTSPKANLGTQGTEWTDFNHGGEQADFYAEAVALTSGSLPDVVDKAVFRRSNSLKAPPKPPRLFLFRSSSINNPRSSLDGGSGRNSLVNGDGQEGTVDVLAEAEPIYVNSAFGAALKTGLSCNDRIIPPSLHNNNIIKATIPENEVSMELSRQVPVFKMAPPNHNGVLPHVTKPVAAVTATITTSSTTTPNYHTLPNRINSHNTQRQKVLSPTLSLKHTSRPRFKSSDRSDLSRHKHIMYSVVDLLCQRFDPFPLLDTLQAAGILGEMDLQAFRGHPDRKLICENLVNLIADGDYAQFLAFIDVIRKSGDNEEILRVLDAMSALDRLIHDIPCHSDSGEHDEAQVLADEKMISYEVGYLASDGVTLKPIVELERVRVNKRASRLSALVAPVDGDCNDNTSKNGDTGSDSTVANTGPVMLNACVTGHNLSGVRALALAEVIKQHDCLLELRIGKTQLCNADVEAICAGLAQNSSLASLDIRLNTLELAGASAVAAMLSQTQTLRQLNLSSTGLDVVGCRAVMSSLSSNKTLTSLDMSFLDVGDGCCDFVRDMLKANNYLQKLRLRSCNFSAAGCFKIADGLNRNRSLVELDLSRNFIGDEGMAALAQYIQDSSLVELSLENCGITALGCDAVAQMVTGSKRLRHLDLSVNFLGDTGVCRLAAALERSSVLHTVSLNMCGITNDGFSKLLDMLEKNASIALLKLCYNRLGREFLNPLATSDNLRYRLRIVTSSKPKLKILLWGNAFDES